MPLTEWDVNNRNLFLTVLQAGRPSSRHTFGVWWGPSTWLRDGHLCTVPSHGGLGERPLRGLLYKGTNPTHDSCFLMTQSPPRCPTSKYQHDFYVLPCCCECHYFTLFMAGYYFITRMYPTFFIHSSVDRHLGCVHVLAIVKQGCNEHWGARIFLNHGFLWRDTQEWDCWIIWQFYF